MSIPAIKDFNDYNKYASEADFTTEAQAQEYQGNQNVILTALVRSYLWQPGMAYAVGWRLRTPSMPAGMEGVCVTAGTSSNVEPEWGTAAGVKIADGTAFWQLIPLAVTVDGIEQDEKGNITLPTMTGATSEAAGTAGKVPAPPAGGANRYLDADGTFKKLPVTSVNGLTGDVGLGGAQGVNPAGTVIAFAGNTVPDGYLLCNGAAVSRTTYAALYAAIGTTYGTGDGSTTFNLPNLTDRFIEGSSSAGSYVDAGVPNATGEAIHFINWGDGVGFDMFSGALYSNEYQLLNTHTGDATTPQYNDKGYKTRLDLSRSNPIYGNSNTVQPPAVTMRFCIKY